MRKCLSILQSACYKPSLFFSTTVTFGPHPDSLLEKIGGPSVFEKISADLHEKISMAPEMKGLYKGLDKNQLNDIKVSFLQYVFRTIPGSHPKNMETVRIFSTLGFKEQHLKIQSHFISDTLRGLNVDAKVIEEALDNLRLLQRRAQEESASLFEKIGREAGIRKIVNIFYQKVLKDKDLKIFFEFVDTDHLVQHQTYFLSAALGNKLEFSRANLKAIHSAFDLNDDLFFRMKLLLAESLRESGGLSLEEIDQALQYIENQRLLVLNKRPVYEVLGKKEGISKLTKIFHEEVLKDEILKKFLNEDIISKMKDRQEQFLCSILGGEPSEKTTDIIEAHHKLAITDIEFDAMKRCLAQSVIKMNPLSEQYLVNECLWAFELLRKKIVQKSLASILEESGISLKEIEEALASNLAEDPDLRVHFKKLNQEELSRHAKMVLTFFLHVSQIGYRNKDLELAHKPLGILMPAWESFVGIFIKVLKEKGVDAYIIAAVRLKLEERKNLIVS